MYVYSKCNNLYIINIITYVYLVTHNKLFVLPI
jgi:hypothetical protein